MSPEGASRGQVTRDRILEAALELFADNGFDRTSMRQIAERVGINKASLYYHFTGKEEIFAALAHRVYGIGHYLGLDQLLPEDGRLDMPALAAGLEQLLDQVLANRRVVTMLERNRATWRAVGGEDPVHLEQHRQLERRWNHLMTNPQVPVRSRVRLSAALGALIGGALGVSPGLGPVPLDELHQEEHDELVAVLRDVLADPAAAGGDHATKRRRIRATATLAPAWTEDGVEVAVNSAR